MNYEFKINRLAEEFGVTEYSLLGWIKAGNIKAKEGPGRRYMMDIGEYRRICRKFGKKPKLYSSDAVNPGKGEFFGEEAVAPPLTVSGQKSRFAVEPAAANACLTCGTCASACPITGVDDMDPRKAVRMAVLGLDQELIESEWPWKCTMCAKCEQACPANIQIVSLIRSVRGQREREKVPDPIHKGVALCLERGNNLGIPDEDFEFLCMDIGEELAAEGCPGFKTPFEKKNERVLITINSKEPFAEPEDMKFWWKIFYAAKESWTISAVNWEGVNWGLFSGDNAAMKTVVGRIVDNMRRLNCKVLLLPE